MTFEAIAATESNEVARTPMEKVLREVTSLIPSYLLIITLGYV